MIAWDWTASAGTGTWDGTYWPWDSTSTASAQSWPTRAYDLWRMEEAAAEALRKYEESRAWVKAPVTIRPEFPGISERHILPHRHVSQRPWGGRNFHK